MLALVGLAVIQTAAEDKPAGDRRADDRSDKGTTTTTKGMGVYSGKIVRVDADKHTIVLGDIQGRGGKGTGTGTGTGTGAGKTGSDRNAADTGDKAKAGDRTMTFQASDKTRISLDGKDGKFSDLKSGLYARVHTDRSGTGSSGTGGSGAAGKGDARTGSDTAGKDNSSGTTGRTRTATRIEAFTKAPTVTGTDTAKQTGGTDRNPRPPRTRRTHGRLTLAGAPGVVVFIRPGRIRPWVPNGVGSPPRPARA